MPESRIAQLATSPLLKDFAAGAGQNAVRKVGNFIAPLCMVPDLTFRYKVYTEQNRYRMPNTERQPGMRDLRRDTWRRLTPSPHAPALSPAAPAGRTPLQPMFAKQCGRRSSLRIKDCRAP